MNIIYSLLILILVPFIGVSMAKANSCTKAYAPKTARAALASEEMKRLVDESLYVIRENEARSLRIDQIALLNKETFANLRVLSSDKTNLKTLSYDEAQVFINEIARHPIYGSYGPYERPGVSIGYCFGRAYGVHRAALAKGFSKDQIRKLWVVGPMDSGWNKWQFHVATAVRDGNGTWWVIDTFTGKPMIPEDWFSVFKKQSEDGKLRIYATNPEKFAPTPGKYSRINLGLDLKKTDDWYLHYFKDANRFDTRK